MSVILDNLLSEEDACDVGHDTDCPFCDGCCECGLCAERAAVIDNEGDELLMDARRDEA